MGTIDSFASEFEVMNLVGFHEDSYVKIAFDGVNHLHRPQAQFNHSVFLKKTNGRIMFGAYGDD